MCKRVVSTPPAPDPLAGGQRGNGQNADSMAHPGLLNFQGGGQLLSAIFLCASLVILLHSEV